MPGWSGPSWGRTHWILAPCLCGQPSQSLQKPFLSPCLNSIRILLLPSANTCFSIPGFWQPCWLTEKCELFCFGFFITVVHETHYKAFSLKCFAVNHCRENKQNSIDGEEVKENVGGCHWLVAPEFFLKQWLQSFPKGDWERLWLCLGSHWQSLMTWVKSSCSDSPL